MSNPEDALYSPVQPRPTQYPLMLKLGIAGSAFVLAAGAFMLGRESVSPEDNSCPSPSPEAIQAVTAMFDAPQPGPISTDNDPGRFERQRAFEEVKIKELGITMPQVDDEALSDLDIALDASRNHRPFSDYMDAAQAVLSQLGISIMVGAPDSLSSDYHADAPTAADLESLNAKYQLLRLTRMFAYVPINLSAHTGVKRVSLTARASYAGLALNNETLIVDVVNAHDNNQIAPHELFHLIDADGCAGKDPGDDPGYVSLNHHMTYAGQWPPPDGFLAGQPKRYDDVRSDVASLRGDQLEAGQRGDQKAYCQADAKLAGLLGGVEAMDDYSHKGVVEDKANLGKEILSIQTYSEMLDHKAPVRRAKFLFLLARIQEEHPEMVQYYSLLAVRPPQPFDCNN